MAYAKDAANTSYGFAVQSANVSTPGSGLARVFLKEVAGVTAPYIILGDATVLGPYQPVSSSLTPAGVIYSQTSSGVIGNTALQLSLCGTGEGTLTLPVNFLVDGRVIRLTAGGFYSSAAAATDVTIRFLAGATVLVNTGTLTLPVSEVDQMWEASMVLVCRVAGVSATTVAHGSYAYKSVASGNLITAPMIATGGITLNTTTSLAVNLTAQWVTADVSNTITGFWAIVEVLN